MLLSRLFLRSLGFSVFVSGYCVERSFELVWLKGIRLLVLFGFGRGLFLVFFGCFGY